MAQKSMTRWWQHSTHDLTASVSNGSLANWRKRQRKKRKCSCFREYCANTSLHGLKYVADDNTYSVEKIFWFICLCGSLAGATYFLLPCFTKYYESRVVTRVESMEEPIWRISFPGVTICNVNKANGLLVKEESNKPPWANTSQEIVKQIVDTLSYMGQVDTNKEPELNDSVRMAYNAYADDIDSLMRNVMQPLERMILKCWWIGDPVNCSEIFSLKRTDEGYCWAFNAVPMRSIEPGTELYKKSHTKVTKTSDFTPLTVHGAGPNMGLTVLLNPDEDQYVANSNNFCGFKVLVHDPEDFPDIGTKGFVADAGREMFVAVTPTATLSSDEIKALKPKTRRCYLPRNEVDLNLFTTYSYDNCLLECKVSSMNKTCKCIPYIYNQLRNVETCDYDQMACINNNTKKFSSIASRNDKLESPDMMHCACPKSCEEVVYITEVTSATFPLYPHEVIVPPDVGHLNKSRLSLLRIFFKDLSFVLYRQELLYSWDDLIAAFGGIVGLFVGFSFISAAEVMFYFILKPIIRCCGYFGPSAASNDQN